jgi:hypothetical protein
MSKPNAAKPTEPGSIHVYRVRIAANGHWAAACKTIRVRADSADNARAEALRHRAVTDWPNRLVTWTRRIR